MIDEKFYTEVYQGMPPREDQNLSSFIARAKRDVDALIGNRYVDDWQMEALNNAIAAQAEHYILYGDVLLEGSQTVTSVSIGSFKESYGSGNSMKVDPHAHMTISLLRDFGLLSRVIGTYSSHWMGDEYRG